MSSPSSEYAQAQTALTTVVQAAIVSAYERAGSDPQALLLATTAVVRSYGSVAAQQAIRYYLGERARHPAARSPFRPSPALPAADDVLARTVDWATTPLPGDDVDSAMQRLQGTADRLVLNAGRDTITEAVEQDREARGWARSIGLSACSFCAMLAARGAVYKEHSFDRSDRKFKGTVSTIKVHDHCHCFPTPVFTAYEPPAHVRRLQADWATVTKGLSGKDARLAWRRHIEGRTIPARPGGE